MRLEGDAFFFNLAELRKAEYLKSTGIGQCRAVPAGKALQAAHCPDDAVAGTNMQMIGIAEHYLTVDRLQIARR